MFLDCNIIVQDQIQFILSVPHTRDGSYGIMGISISFGQDEGGFVGIFAPFFQYLIPQPDQALTVGAMETDSREQPTDDTGRNIGIIRKRELLFNRGFRHLENVIAALKVVVDQYRTANDRQVYIGADDIMGKEFDEIHQFGFKGVLQQLSIYLYIEKTPFLNSFNILSFFPRK